MNQTQIISAIVVVLIGAVIILWYRTFRQSPYEAAKESMAYQSGPIRHAELPASLIERIQKLKETFAEIYPVTHEEWLAGFKRDANPEREIAIWEYMASAYTQFLKTGNFDTDARGEIFGVLLTRSSTTDLEPLISNLEYLNENQARSLLSLYEAGPQPITINNAQSDSSSNP
ncbi:MAG: hypothetical protein D3913_04945 [Candidatus Electrothrix sp. LOE1_4_5]|nr:hypothetical protein [Candidatus Electrothrix gigas]